MTKCNIALDFFWSVVAFPKISPLGKSHNCSFIKIKIHVKNLKTHSARAQWQRLTISSPHHKLNLKIIFFIGAHIYRVVIGKFIEDLIRSPTQLWEVSSQSHKIFLLLLAESHWVVYLGSSWDIKLQLNR